MWLRSRLQQHDCAGVWPNDLPQSVATTRCTRRGDMYVEDRCVCWVSHTMCGGQPAWLQPAEGHSGPRCVLLPARFLSVHLKVIGHQIQ